MSSSDNSMIFKVLLAGLVIYAVYMFLDKPKRHHSPHGHNGHGHHHPTDQTPCAVNCTERMNYLPQKEGLGPVPRPQFQRMKNVERFVSRDSFNPVSSSEDYKNLRENFSNDFANPKVPCLQDKATLQSPFIGSLQNTC
jgi:hypothetical protein